MKFRTTLVKLAMLLLIAPAALAQQPTTPTDPAAAKSKLAAPLADLGCTVLTGRVTDPFAYPLMGATIMLREPGKGFSPDAYSTNAEGHYIITSKQAFVRNTLMEVTAPGYTPLTLPLSNCQPLDITLTPVAGLRYKATSRSRRPRPAGRP